MFYFAEKKMKDSTEGLGDRGKEGRIPFSRSSEGSHQLRGARGDS